jgi:hypothetical protein
MMPLAAGERDASRMALARAGAAACLSSAQYSMRNFASGIGVRRDGLRAPHDVDGVDVELPATRGVLVGTVREHADAGHEDDRRSAPRIAGESASAWRS